LIFGSIWLGEAVSVHLLLAIALVAGGITLVNRKPAN
jgi:drug/metabolite transporter (DMT)-like permease